MCHAGLSLLVWQQLCNRARSGVTRHYSTQRWRDVFTKCAGITQGADHYKSMAIQPSEFIHRNNMNWCEGSAIKYICRHHLKGGKQDLEKAKHFIDMIIERDYD